MDWAILISAVAVAILLILVIACCVKMWRGGKHSRFWGEYNQNFLPACGHGVASANTAVCRGHTTSLSIPAIDYPPVYPPCCTDLPSYALDHFYGL